MSLRLARAAAILVGAALIADLVGCGGKPAAAPDAGAASSGGGSGGGGDAGQCQPPATRACSTQVECGEDRRSFDSITCEPSDGGTRCAFQGSLDGTCQTVAALIQVQADLNPIVVQNAPRSLLFRGFFPRLSDGGTATCAEVATLAQQPGSDGGLAIDANGALNFSFWGAIPIVGAAQSTVVFNATMVPHAGEVFYVEAYGGGINSPGTRVGAGCAENVIVDAPADGGLQPPIHVTLTPS